jgi:hypothetical protein
MRPALMSEVRERKMSKQIIAIVAATAFAALFPGTASAKDDDNCSGDLCVSYETYDTPQSKTSPDEPPNGGPQYKPSAPREKPSTLTLPGDPVPTTVDRNLSVSREIGALSCVSPRGAPASIKGGGGAGGRGGRGGGGFGWEGMRIVGSWGASASRSARRTRLPPTTAPAGSVRG